MTVYRCEDSLEGIFTAVYLAYEEKRDHKDTYLSLNEDAMLFAEDVWVVPDPEKTKKVMNTLLRRFGEEDYLSLCQALAARDEEKAQAVYRTVVDGLKRNAGRGHLFDNLADDDVNRAFKLSRRAGREIQHLMGFVRFQETEKGVLYSKIAPENNILTFLMPHFADRLPTENFVIYDVGRGFFGIHPAGGQWYLLLGQERVVAAPRLSEEELYYQALFKGFCESITIEGRENGKLQQSLLPLRFREYMIEFR